MSDAALEFDPVSPEFFNDPYDRTFVNGVLFRMLLGDRTAETPPKWNAFCTG